MRYDKAYEEHKLNRPFRAKVEREERRHEMMQEMTNAERFKKACEVDEYRARSFLVGNPMPELGEIIDTAFGKYVVRAHNWGGDGWINTVPLEAIK